MDAEVRKLIQTWIDSALGDLKVAESQAALPDDEAVIHAVCFHSQQAVEKLLKAFLMGHTVDFPKTHNLEKLTALCTHQDSEFASLEVGGLTEYAVEARYPDLMQTATLAQAKQALTTAQRARDFILPRVLQ